MIDDLFNSVADKYDRLTSLFNHINHIILNHNLPEEVCSLDEDQGNEQSRRDVE